METLKDQLGNFKLSSRANDTPPLDLLQDSKSKVTYIKIMNGSLAL
jgi:hypothetical protein